MTCLTALYYLFTEELSESVEGCSWKLRPIVLAVLPELVRKLHSGVTHSNVIDATLLEQLRQQQGL